MEWIIEGKSNQDMVFRYEVYTFPCVFRLLSHKNKFGDSFTMFLFGQLLIKKDRGLKNTRIVYVEVGPVGVF